jgi:hypothetical protein
MPGLLPALQLHLPTMYAMAMQARKTMMMMRMPRKMTKSQA